MRPEGHPMCPGRLSISPHMLRTSGFRFQPCLVEFSNVPSLCSALWVLRGSPHVPDFSIPLECERVNSVWEPQPMKGSGPGKFLSPDSTVCNGIWGGGNPWTRGYHWIEAISVGIPEPPDPRLHRLPPSLCSILRALMLRERPPQAVPHVFIPADSAHRPPFQN